jgi:NAD(P)-dependent dehydrogenase (short-subunit alcohol dehydrogenase family)
MSTSAPRTALVTGGATGIGAAITERLASDGMNVFVVQRDTSKAEAGQQRFDRHVAADRIHVAVYDLSTGNGCADAVAECISRFAALDVLVNNAGLSGEAVVGPLSQCSDAQIDRIIDTNLKAPLRLAREGLRYLTIRKGVIVNISSVAELQAQAEAAAYVASKAGLGGLTRALALDLAAQGVRVVGLAPGDIATQTSRDPGFAAKRKHITFGKRVPMGFAAEPEDVADAVAWIVSDQARYVTGSTIVIDGGLTAY